MDFNYDYQHPVEIVSAADVEESTPYSTGRATLAGRICVGA